MSETAFARIEVSTDDRKSFETGTALISLQIRLDRRVTMDPKNMAELQNRVDQALEPFKEWSRPL